MRIEKRAEAVMQRIRNTGKTMAVFLSDEGIKCHHVETELCDQRMDDSIHSLVGVYDVDACEEWIVDDLMFCAK